MFKLFFVLALSLLSLYADAPFDNILHRHHLHDKVGEKYCKACEDGIIVESDLILDFLKNISGGKRHTSTILGNFDLTIEVDTDKAGLWQGGHLYTYVLGNFSSNRGMSNYAGDFQVSSNIEAEDALRLYEFWYEHRVAKKVSLLLGLHDYNSEFNTLEYGSLFINSSFGMQPDISQVPPSIFPYTALGLRVAVKLAPKSYMIAAVYDGITGDPRDSKRTAIRFDKGDGVFASTEIGLIDGDAHTKEYYKLAMGVWYHTANVENFASVIDDENQGIYFMGEKTLFEDSQKALGVFFQLGFADSTRNQVDRYIGLGLNYKGLFASRSDDLLGLALASAFASDAYKQFNGTSITSHETVIELTYEAHLNDRFLVQPNIQYIFNPSMDETIDDATVVGFRLILEL